VRPRPRDRRARRSASTRRGPPGRSSDDPEPDPVAWRTAA
jgi:hypothetical protein